MDKITLKVPYGHTYWVRKLGATWDKVYNLWYIDANVTLPKRVQDWVVKKR
jgi:hypothetical protein